MTEKKALGHGAKCCGECDLCAAPPAVEETTMFEVGDELLAELLAGVDANEEEDE